MAEPTHGALFAGIGGFELGAERASFRTVWNAEFDPTPSKSTGKPTPMQRQWPVRVLKRHFPEVPNLGDVTLISRPEPVDVVSFGSPCQDLSVAGQRRGFTPGSRSHLFFEAARIIEECRPSFAIWENVPGAFSANAGRDFYAVLRAMEQLGAHDVAWRVFDSQYAGVPQQRRRIYLVADFGGRRAGEILFDPEGCGGHPSPSIKEGPNLAGALTSGTSRAGINKPGRRGEDDYNLIARALSGVGGGQDYGSNKGTLTSGKYLETTGVSSPVVSKWAKGSGGPAGDEVQNLVPVAFEPRHFTRGKSGPPSDQATALTADSDRGDGQALAFQPRIARNGRGSPRTTVPALQAQSGEDGRGDGASMLMAYGAIRRFSPLECERLQGFPDHWTCLCGANDVSTCKCPDGPRYRALGNACTVNVTEWLFRRLRTYF